MAPRSGRAAQHMRKQPHAKKRSEKTDKGHRIISIAATLQSMNKGFPPSDVTGSYTGMTSTNEAPEQDADDL